MPKRAQFFIGLILAVGSAFLIDSLSRDRVFVQLEAYVCYFALALLASSLKVRLPGITGTISVNFLFVLVAIAVFTFAETVVLAAVASIVQSLWKPKRRPKIIQVCFNSAVLAISAGVAHRAAHALVGTREHSLLVLLALAACFYFTANTLLVSGILSLVDHKRLVDVWKQCYFWSFPYYLAGAVIAGLIVACGQTVGWVMPLLLLPLMLMVYMFYRIFVERFAS